MTLKYKKYDILSYVNNKKKIINAKVIGFSDNSDLIKFLNEWGVTEELEKTYKLKTRNGKIVFKYESEVELVKNTRLEKLERIIKLWKI